MSIMQAMEQARVDLAMQRILLTTAAYEVAFKARVAELTTTAKSL